MSEGPQTRPVPRLMVAPPPIHFVIAFVTAYALDRVVPLPRPPSAEGELLRTAGWCTFALGHLVMFAAMSRFVRVHTTIVPTGHATSLVTSGIYSFTRNPMYVGLTIAYLGLTMQQRLLWAIPWVALPLTTLSRVIIPFEEARLRALFGDAYAAYCARVRRWI